VAVVSFVFSFLAKKAGDIAQAIFGWSITALFGKLSRRALILMIGALVLSLLWPLFVAGAVYPPIANWAIAFVPLHAWIGNAVMRAIWLALAITAPVGVALLVRAAAPTGKRSVASTMVRGYPMALGFFVGFLAILVTVPLIKVASIARGWSDEHVYVQPHEGQYAAVMRSLAEACARAGYEPAISDAPKHMDFATHVMRWFARGAVTPLVPAQLRRITIDDVQMYQYPADLMLRGTPKKVARIRAMLSRTNLDAEAYLVSSDAARKVQDELARLNDVLRDRVDRDLQPGAILATRLREVFREMMHVDVSYEEWTLLEAMARRFERRLIVANVVPSGSFPLDDEPDALPEVARRANATAETPRGDRHGTYIDLAARPAR
jgi:hypothetical protein